MDATEGHCRGLSLWNASTPPPRVLQGAVPTGEEAGMTNDAAKDFALQEGARFEESGYHTVRVSLSISQFLSGSLFLSSTPHRTVSVC